ncbi:MULTISPECIES: helix-turn-helix domain-containing protein [pseudomallei group]|uniref:helix-turn-helix domain-containing protein n=1 Tax=pseudomallei group TaxID=111527 RepID=UPI00059C196C|nr:MULTISPECIES: helix-turn-helix transcriptional regulator [pseudomallei group]MCS3396914.1 helix-turn-helix domain-containing protein [Burkholderia thailandensis]MUV27197.1 helix-turn-helix domain-containing protein [Burkholderia thailandensis]QIO10880.1 helix-turn-helix transcriptional regulator [Burkholderia thailandensis]
MHRAPGSDDVSQELALLGRAIRAVRKEKRISQEELADIAGLDRSHMGRIERGERNVSFLNLVRVAHALDCKLSEILAASGL